MSENFIYEMGPVDYWENAVSEEQYLANLREWGSQSDRELRDWEKLKNRAFAAARMSGCHWEGDYGTLYIVGLPSPSYDPNLSILLYWKQGNNGTTFLWSPYRLEYLHTSDSVRCFFVPGGIQINDC